MRVLAACCTPLDKAETAVVHLVDKWPENFDHQGAQGPLTLLDKGLRHLDGMLEGALSEFCGQCGAILTLLRATQGQATPSAARDAVQCLNDPSATALMAAMTRSAGGASVLAECAALQARHAADGIADSRLAAAEKFLAHAVTDPCVLTGEARDVLRLFGRKQLEREGVVNVLRESFSSAQEAMSSWSVIRAEEQKAKMQAWCGKLATALALVDASLNADVVQAVTDAGRFPSCACAARVRAPSRRVSGVRARVIF